LFLTVVTGQFKELIFLNNLIDLQMLFCVISALFLIRNIAFKGERPQIKQGLLATGLFLALGLIMAISLLYTISPAYSVQKLVRYFSVCLPLIPLGYLIINSRAAIKRLIITVSAYGIFLSADLLIEMLPLKPVNFVMPLATDYLIASRYISYAFFALLIFYLFEKKLKTKILYLAGSSLCFAALLRSYARFTICTVLIFIALLWCVLIFVKFKNKVKLLKSYACLFSAFVIIFAGFTALGFTETLTMRLKIFGEDVTHTSTQKEMSQHEQDVMNKLIAVNGKTSEQLYSPKEIKDMGMSLSYEEKEKIFKSRPFSSRTKLFEKSMMMIKDRPILGYGIGSFSAYYINRDGYGYPHVVLTELWAELGLFGILIFLFALVFAIREIYRGIKIAPESFSKWYIIYILIAFNLFLLVFTSDVVNGTRFLYVILASAFGIRVALQRRNGSEIIKAANKKGTVPNDKKVKKHPKSI
jgi:hypothetical protein